MISDTLKVLDSGQINQGSNQFLFTWPKHCRGTNATSIICGKGRERLIRAATTLMSQTIYRSGTYAVQVSVLDG